MTYKSNPSWLTCSTWIIQPSIHGQWIESTRYPRRSQLSKNRGKRPDKHDQEHNVKENPVQGRKKPVSHRLSTHNGPKGDGSIHFLTIQGFWYPDPSTVRSIQYTIRTDPPASVLYSSLSLGQNFRWNSLHGSSDGPMAGIDKNAKVATAWFSTRRRHSLPVSFGDDQAALILWYESIGPIASTIAMDMIWIDNHLKIVKAKVKVKVKEIEKVKCE